MRGHSGETFHSRAGPRGGTRPERGWSCCLGQSPSPCPVFPGPPASQPALPGRRWRLGSAGRLFSVGPVFAPLPGRAGAALAPAEPAGKGQSRCQRREGPAAALTPGLPGRERGRKGPEGGGEGRDSPGTAWEHLPGQGASPAGRSAPPAPPPPAAPPARPGPGSALPASLPPPGPCCSPFLSHCLRGGNNCSFFPISTPLADFPHLFNTMALSFPCCPPQLRPSSMS